MNSLTLDQILQLHALVLLKDGGSDGIRDIGRLEAVVATQHQVVFGEELYKTIVEKAAAMIRGTIGDHPFVDGNKRTAMLVGLTLLELNSYVSEIAIGALEDFAVRVAVEQLSVEEIATWLEAHSRNI